MSLLEQSLRKHLKERVKAIIRELHTEHLDRNAVAAIMNALVEDKDQITDQNIDDVCQLLNSNESISSARDFGQMIKKMFANEIEINDERIREIALDLLETIDIDKSGSIEYNEFYEFFSKLDDLEVNQEIMENIFNSFDSNK
jgi:Ca2+-binding EF-hand superfamily protein